MTRKHRLIVIGLIVGGLALVLSLTGCKMLSYPVARGFGGMKQSEIKKNRAAFVLLKGDIRAREIVVYPVLVVKGDRPTWDVEAGDRLRGILGDEHGLKTVASGVDPGVPYQVFKGNQLRYHNTRARAYAAWVRSLPKTGRYHWFMEIYAGPGGDPTHAMHVFLVDEEGRIPYCRLTNSHHYGTVPLRTIAERIQFMVRIFFIALEAPPEQVWPPFGVG